MNIVKSLAVGIATVVAAVVLVVIGVNVYIYFAFQKNAPPGTEIGWDPISMMHGWGFSTFAIELVFLGTPLFLFLAGSTRAYRRFVRKSRTLRSV